MKTSAPKDSFPLSFCPTGMVPQKSDTPHIPISHQEIAKQVSLVSEIGITSVHLHARNDDGSPAWERRSFEKTIELIKNSNPELIIVLRPPGVRFLSSKNALLYWISQVILSLIWRR